jgi:hypothetical protein
MQKEAKAQRRPGLSLRTLTTGSAEPGESERVRRSKHGRILLVSSQAPKRKLWPKYERQAQWRSRLEKVKSSCRASSPERLAEVPPRYCSSPLCNLAMGPAADLRHRATWRLRKMARVKVSLSLASRGTSPVRLCTWIHAAIVGPVGNKSYKTG